MDENYRTPFIQLLSGTGCKILSCVDDLDNGNVEWIEPDESLVSNPGMKKFGVWGRRAAKYEDVGPEYTQYDLYDREVFCTDPSTWEQVKRDAMDEMAKRVATPNIISRKAAGLG